MKIKQIELYTYDELSKDARERALNDFREHNEFNDFLEEDLSEYLKQLLEENGLKGNAKLYYSLGYSQGDGVCFEGNFEYKSVSFNVKHTGHYYHSNSVTINADIENDDDDLKTDVIELLEEEFKGVYKSICDKIEKSGYEDIEYQNSEENFKELCEINEYTFRASGKMENF